MTTSNEEIHIKPIIVSHQYRHQSQESSPVTPSSLENNISNLPKASSSFKRKQNLMAKTLLVPQWESAFGKAVAVKRRLQKIYKRVSFGNSKGTVVETFIYESVPTIEEGFYGPTSHSGGSHTQVREHIDTAPSKVKVKTLESQIPSYISPPSTISSLSQSKLNNGGIASGVLIREKDNVVSSSPSPVSQNMEEGAENPFRPDGRLSHEVDPIVECYKKRPFPVSTGSDVVDGEVVNVGSSKSPPSSPPGKKAANSPPPVAQSSKNGGREAVAKPQDIKLTLTTADGHNTQLEIQHKQLTSPKAGHVEMVHIGGKRKRCGCCSIQ